MFTFVRGKAQTGRFPLVVGLVFGLTLLAPMAARADTNLDVGGTGRIAYANGDDVRLRVAPGYDEDVITLFPEGSTVDVLDGPFQVEDGTFWYQVAVGGQTGFMVSDYLARADAPVDPGTSPDDGFGDGDAPAQGTAVTTSELNLRDGPGYAQAILTVMPFGAGVEVLGHAQNGFSPVVFNGQVGWAAVEFLDYGGVPTSPPDDGGTEVPSDGSADSDPNNDGVTTEDEIIAIIYAAADRYGQPREDMLRVARCESDLVPTAVNKRGGSYGLFQFKSGTWLGTPFAEYDIFDPRANANAAAWMWAQGRRREWVCQ